MLTVVLYVAITPYRIALTDLRQRTNFSVHLSSFCECLFCQSRFGQSGGFHRTKAPTRCTISMRWHVFCSVGSIKMFCVQRVKKCIETYKKRILKLILKLKPTDDFIACRPKAALLFCLLFVVLFHFFLARFIAVVSIVSICLVCDFNIVASCAPISAVRFAFC